jgi:hypothetical protein
LTKTFDNKRLVRPLTLIDIDSAFFSWWDRKLNVHLSNDRGERKKVPVFPLSPERWSLAREEGIRDQNGTLAIPIIVVARTAEGGPNETPYQRIFADLKQDHVYYKQVDPKSSLIKELNKRRPKSVDPDSPIYEVYTHRAPDHYVLTYTVDIWTPTMEDMNTIIEKIGQELEYKSVKSFQFKTLDGYVFQAFQEEGLNDSSNIDDFTGKERLVRKTVSFKVPAYIMPESDQRRDVFKRYFSQTKLVIKDFFALSQDEYERFLNGEDVDPPQRSRVSAPTYAPFSSIAPTISGLPLIGSTLSCDVGIWGYSGTISYTYQWRRNGVNISGATNSTYTLVAADGSRNIDCVVVATNEIGSTSAASNILTIVSGDVYVFVTENGDVLTTEDGLIIILE